MPVTHDCDWLLSVEEACDWLRIEPSVTGNFLLKHPVGSSEGGSLVCLFYLARLQSLMQSEAEGPGNLSGLVCRDRG